MNATALIIAAAIALFLYVVAGRLYKFVIFYRKVNKIPGPTYMIPFIGIVYELSTMDKADRLEWLKNKADMYNDGYFRTWLGTIGSVHIHKPKHIEVLLRSHTEITKSMGYRYLKPWLGQGLLTSTGQQWFHSRKLITPAFHFNILEEFALVMMDKTAILTKCIEQEIKINGDKPFDIFQLCLKGALDIICETAMGVDIHAQEVVDNKYTKAVHTISEGAVNRLFRPWLKLDCIYYNTAEGKKYQAAVDEAHDLCTRVIKRKQEERKLEIESGVVSNGDEVTGKRKRRAFLDLLLEANEKEDNPLTIEDLRDQANTFMFAGHDTTGSLISWTLFCLGNELDIQKKVHEELDEVLGDADEQTTLKELPNLKYLDRVIKEVLRLYPSAPSVGRLMTNDLQIGDYIIPKGATVSVHIYQVHRDEEFWPDPLRFDPDRFLPENVKGRHPYAFIPFSAGPRNCIGQKYAQLEAKIALAQILRNFSVKSVDTHSTVKKYSEIILRPVDGIYVNMKKRSAR